VVMSTRVNDPKNGGQGRRNAALPPAGSERAPARTGRLEHLCLPAEYEGSRAVSSIGFTDPRTEHGELLWPERFGPAEIESPKVTLASYAAAGQLQQRPSPAGGGIFKRHWSRGGADGHR
jgi:hypothetical protein